MSKYFVIFLKLCVMLFAVSCKETVEEPSSNQLLAFWEKKISLSPDEQKQHALENIASSDDGYLKAISNFTIGYYHTRDRDYGSAMMHYLQAEYDLAESGVVDDKLIGHLFRNKGAIFRMKSLYKQAISFYDSALSHYNHYPEDFVKERLATTYNKSLALSYFDHEQALEQAQGLYKESLFHENINYELKALMLMGDIYVRTSDYINAKGHLDNAIQLFESTGTDSPNTAVQLYQSLGRVYYHLNDFPEQERYLEKSLQVGVVSRNFLINVDLGENLIRQDKKQEALSLLTDLEEEYDEQPLHPNNIRIYELLAEVSPNSARSSYEAKEQEEKAKYEQEKEAMMAQERKERFELMANQVALQNKRAEERAASQRRETYQLFGFGLLLVLIFLFVGYKYRYFNRLIVAYNASQTERERKRREDEEYEIKVNNLIKQGVPPNEISYFPTYGDEIGRLWREANEEKARVYELYRKMQEEKGEKDDE